ncbi:unnamed protein product [Auanema sp. JU1783]|nr:unnamed protein product [Auanema sp. JU1783]
MLLRTNSFFLTRRCFSKEYPCRITPGEYKARRSKLLVAAREQLKNNDKDFVILSKGASTSFLAPDVPHTFRQLSHFRYITGIDNVPGCSYLFYSSSTGQSRRILFMDKRTEYEELWEGSLPSCEELEKMANFDEVLPTKEISTILQKMITNQTVLFAEANQWSTSQTSSCFSKASTLRALNPLIEKLRIIKSPDEILAMEDVCKLGCQMMASMIANSKNVESERTLVGLLEYESRRRGAERLAYPPVVAGGLRANTIHYLAANSIIKENECILVDAGCDLNGYVSDITRCFPQSGHWTDPQRSLYEALRYVHENLLQFSHEAENIRLSTIYHKMNELLASVLTEVGLIPTGVGNKEAIKFAEELCPHHVSHYLGMDVHDCASVSRDIPLQDGCIFTIEPGIYVPRDARYPEEYQGIGFRIEDDILKTKNGIRVLTDSLPRLGQDIENLMAN